MYFHTDDTATLEFIERIANRAANDGLSLRFDVDSNGGLKVKVGGGQWTAPFPSTPDPYRDRSN